MIAEGLRLAFRTVGDGALGSARAHPRSTPPPGNGEGGSSARSRCRGCARASRDARSRERDLGCDRPRNRFTGPSGAVAPNSRYWSCRFRDSGPRRQPRMFGFLREDAHGRAQHRARVGSGQSAGLVSPAYGLAQGRAYRHGSPGSCARARKSPRKAGIFWKQPAKKLRAGGSRRGNCHRPDGNTARTRGARGYCVSADRCVGRKDA